MSLLFKYTAPFEGRTNLHNVFNKVDFPHPFEPIITLILCSGVEPHFISEKNKEKLQNKKANGWRVMPYSTA